VEPHVEGLLDDQVHRRADAAVEQHVRLPVLDLEELRREVDHRAVEDDRLQLGAGIERYERLLGLVDQAHAVVRVLRDQRGALEAPLLDPARPHLATIGIDHVRAEGVVQVLLGDLPRGGLSGEHRDLELLGERLDRRHHRAVELPDDRDRLILSRELAEPGRALFRRAGVVLDDQLDFPPAEDTAPHVHFFRAHLGSTGDELSGGRVSWRRERREDADLHGLLGESRDGEPDNQERCQ